MGVAAGKGQATAIGVHFVQAVPPYVAHRKSGAAPGGGDAEDATPPLLGQAVPP